MAPHTYAYQVYNQIHSLVLIWRNSQLFSLPSATLKFQYRECFLWFPVLYSYLNETPI